MDKVQNKESNNIIPSLKIFREELDIRQWFMILVMSRHPVSFIVLQLAAFKDILPPPLYSFLTTLTSVGDLYNAGICYLDFIHLPYVF
jgi:hypothetical protein